MTTVAQEIDAQAPNPMVRLAMRLGALLEGGTLGPGPFSVGDQGHSHGPFQINLPFHPGVTAANAEDPAFAVHYMLPSYLSAASKIPTTVWQANPELAAEQTARAAERPLYDYFDPRSAGQSGVDAKWKIASGQAPSPGAAALAAASGGGSAASSTSPTGATDNRGCSSPSGLGALINAPGWVSYFFCRLEQDAKPALFETAAVVAGAGLVVVGLVKTVSRSQTFKTAKAAASSAATKGVEMGAVA